MRPTILLIDDDPMVARLVELSLQPEGYLVIIAASGEEGLKMVAAQPPNLVLLDLMLPEPNGFQVLEQLRSNPQTAHIPVVVISSKAQRIDRQTAAEIGANAYLTKPYKRAELVDTISALLATGT